MHLQRVSGFNVFDLPWAQVSAFGSVSKIGLALQSHNVSYIPSLPLHNNLCEPMIDKTVLALGNLFLFTSYQQSALHVLRDYAGAAKLRVRRFG